MRKTCFILFFLVMASLTAHAQINDLLLQIRWKNSLVRTVEGEVQRDLVKNGKETVQDGRFYYRFPNEFATYLESGELFIINENYLKADLGFIRGRFKRSNKKMNSLCNIFLYGFQGSCQAFADENNYSIDIEQEATQYKVTMTSRKKPLLGIGFRQIILIYGLDDMLLKGITIINYNGGIDTYTISNPNYDVAVDDDKFKI